MSIQSKRVVIGGKIHVNLFNEDDSKEPNLVVLDSEHRQEGAHLAHAFRVKDKWYAVPNGMVCYLEYTGWNGHHLSRNKEELMVFPDMHEAVYYLWMLHRITA